MLKDLTRDDWLRILGIPEERIPAVLILRGTRNLRTQYQAVLPFFSNLLEVGTPNGILEDVLIGDLSGRLTTGFACVYGPSMASEIVHVFGVLGTRTVIQTGNCGALSEGMRAGDVFIATDAFCGEGASRYYLPGVDRVAASPELLESASLSKADVPQFHCGSIYTTSALFAESAADLENWAQAGYAAVDMETATTFAVAEYFGMQRISILYAFDNPRRREHLLISDDEKDIRRKVGDTIMGQLAFRLARVLLS